MSRINKLKDRVKTLFTFSKSERRGIIWLLPLMVVIGVVIAFANSPRFEKSFMEIADKEDAERSIERRVVQRQPEEGAVDESGGAVEGKEIELFQFDPNRVTIQELTQLGFTPRTAAGIIKYRERGKVFEIAEDFATCYGVTMEHYTLLEPYIVIGSQYRVEGFQGLSSGAESREGRAVKRGVGDKPTPSKPFDPNKLTYEGYVELGFSPRQAEVIISYRESMNGFETADDFASCFVVSEGDMERLSPYIKFETTADSTVAGLPKSPFVAPIEINSADSTQLRRISGVGEVLVGRIIEYRERLGGFAQKEQLSEVEGMVEANYLRICKQIWVDSCDIKKNDINFASHKELVEGLGNHPYVSAKVLRKLLKQRQLRGGWSKLGELVNQNIMTQEEAERLAPYLLFAE